MRTLFAFLLLAIGAGTSLAADPTAGDQPARPVPGDEQDLVVFLDTRPFLIRLHLQVNGRSFRHSWDETIGRLFDYLDADRDGKLSAKEMAAAPSATQWVQLMSGVAVEPDSAPEPAELAGSAAAAKDGVTRQQFLRHYRRLGAGALQAEWGWRPMAQDRLSDALFKRLDRDRDGTLSRQELTAAADALHGLDADGDDIITANELEPGGAYPTFTFRSATDLRQLPPDFPLTILRPDFAFGFRPAEDAGAALARQILNRYDRNKDGKLGRDEVSVDGAVFARLDANRDGALSAAELAGWEKLPPDLELIVPLGAGVRKDVLVLPSDRKARRLTVLRPPAPGALRLAVADKQIDLMRNPAASTVRRALLEQFDALAGKQKVLDEKAIYQPPFTLVAMLRLADHDGDNRLSRKELADFLEMQEKFFFRTSYLTVVDRGPSLFELLDGDHDGRLGPRELRSAWARLAPWADESGRVARRQVPRQFQIVLSHGQPRTQIQAAGPGFADLPLLRDRARGPLWFRKMDRNGDGDVSPREFLGSAEQFRRLDADGDGFIDVAEAERADAAMRKRR